MDLLDVSRTYLPGFEASCAPIFWAVLGLESLGWYEGGGTLRRVTTMLHIVAIFVMKIATIGKK